MNPGYVFTYFYLAVGLFTAWQTWIHATIEFRVMLDDAIREQVPPTLAKLLIIILLTLTWPVILAALLNPPSDDD